MTLKKIADGTVRKLVRSIPGLEFTKTQRAEIARVIESALEDTVAEAAATYQEVAVMCCGPEADLAHKITHEADKRTELLIASLSHQR
jgi:hypothetical protein